MLAVMRRFPEQEHASVLRLCEIISFRYNIIGNRNTNELEKQYNRAAIAVHAEQARSVREISRILMPVYVGDDEFRTDFEYKMIPASGMKRHIVRYILAAFEADLRGTAADSDDDSFTIEHILPENPDAEWRVAFSAEQQEHWISRLGNYLPLEARINREVGAASLAEKLVAYARSSYVSTQRFHADSWSPRDIAARQSEMARRAVHIWRIDH
jgi:hypothetical protein